MKWYNDILDCTHEFVEICLVGNKLDLEHEYICCILWKSSSEFSGSTGVCLITQNVLLWNFGQNGAKCRKSIWVDSAKNNSENW